MGRVNTRLSWNHKYCVEVAYRYDSTFAMRFKVRLRGERREERLILIDSVCSFVSCRVCCRGSTNYLKSKYGASTSRRFEISIHISISQYISFFKLQSVSQSQSAILLDPFFRPTRLPDNLPWNCYQIAHGALHIVCAKQCKMSKTPCQ